MPDEPVNQWLPPSIAGARRNVRPWTDTTRVTVASHEHVSVSDSSTAEGLASPPVLEHPAAWVVVGGGVPVGERHHDAVHV